MVQYILQHVKNLLYKNRINVFKKYTKMYVNKKWMYT